MQIVFSGTVCYCTDEKNDITSLIIYCGVISVWNEIRPPRKIAIRPMKLVLITIVVAMRAKEIYNQPENGENVAGSKCFIINTSKWLRESASLFPVVIVIKLSELNRNSAMIQLVFASEWLYSDKIFRIFWVRWFRNYPFRASMSQIRKSISLHMRNEEWNSFSHFRSLYFMLCSL